VLHSDYNDVMQSTRGISAGDLRALSLLRSAFAYSALNIMFAVRKSHSATSGKKSG